MSFKIGNDTQRGRYGRNIDNCTGVNPQGPTGTIIPETNSTKRFNTFDYIIGTSDLSYRILLWYGAEKSESENFGGNKIFKNAERKKIEVEKLGVKMM